MEAWWTRLRFEPGQRREGDVGELTYAIERRSASWQFSFRRRGESRRPDRPQPSATRAAADEEEFELEFRPALPDRPVVVRLETPYVILPRRDLLFYISMPLWLEVVTPTDGKALASEPTIQLSNTWFGPPNQGRLAYALRIPARSRHEDLPAEPTRAGFPVRLRNASEQTLVLERLCLDPGPLSLFQGETRIWTSNLGIVYRGPDATTRLAYGTRIPVPDGPGPVLREPRAPRPSRLITRTYEAARALDILGP